MRGCGVVLAIAFTISSGAMGMGQSVGVATVGAVADAGKTELLWPEGAPGALGTAEDDKPTLTAYLPASNPTKTAVVIAPVEAINTCRWCMRGPM